MSGMDELAAAVAAELARRDRAQADRAIALDTAWDHPEDEVEVRHLVPGCEWSARGTDDEVDARVRVHLASCARTEEWRVVQLHAGIVASYRTHALLTRDERSRAVVAVLGGVVTALADAYQVTAKEAGGDV